MRNLHHNTVNRLWKLSYRKGLFRTWLNEAEGWVSIARNSSGKVVGWSAVSPNEPACRTTKQYPFIGVYVDEDYRGISIGSNLLEDLVKRTSWFLGKSYMAEASSGPFENVLKPLGIRLKDW